MKLVKIIKTVIHVYAKNKDLQYSFWGASDYTDEDIAEMQQQDWCRKKNAEAGYTKYTFELVKLYGEVRKW